MHKEAHQAAGGPTTLEDTSEKEPTLSSVMILQLKLILDYLLLMISYLHNRIWMKEPKTIHLITYLHSTNKESRADDISKKIKLEDLSEFLKDTRSAFFTPDSPQDDPIIVTNESEEEEADKEDTHDTSHDVPEDTSVPTPPSLKSAQIQELMAYVQLLKSQKDKLEQQKATTEAKVASLKARPSDCLFSSLKIYK
nr:hypothetical protein [Tanacetum cinerariifolium]